MPAELRPLFDLVWVDLDLDDDLDDDGPRLPRPRARVPPGGGRVGGSVVETARTRGARLAWAPEAGRVSARGDMGWTWGTSNYTAPDGTRSQGRYVSIWTRDVEGNWRYAFDAPIK